MRNKVRRKIKCFESWGIKIVLCVKIAKTVFFTGEAKDPMRYV